MWHKMVKLAFGLARSNEVPNSQSNALVGVRRGRVLRIKGVQLVKDSRTLASHRTVDFPRFRVTFPLTSCLLLSTINKNDLQQRILSSRSAASCATRWSQSISER